ncbi:MAG: hypothetical protein L0H64_02370 [Pseudonocardia sp.]|nr:hypothetical protein [Pseudonocardia sp.]
MFGLLRAGTRKLGRNTRATGEATERVYLAMWRAAPCFEPGRRSAYSTMLFAVRCELADQVCSGIMRRAAIGPATTLTDEDQGLPRPGGQSAARDQDWKG